MCVGRGEAPSEPRCRLVNHFLYLLLDPRKAEGGRSLHRREVDGGLERLLPDVIDPGHIRRDLGTRRARFGAKIILGETGCSHADADVH